MVAPQELMVIRDHNHMIKGKRTKRQRPISQISLTMATSSCSSAEVSGGGFGGAAKDEEEEEEDEEEYLANCLILLAKGKTQKLCEQLPAVTRSNVYQCKTCNRCFPSFQALGGHRASHNKPKTRTLEEHVLQISDDHGTNLSLQISKCRGLCSTEKKKSRVHECSICGAEFTSGQALGGHMRRHSRPILPNHDQDSIKAKKSRNLLSLDLNLPAAPEDNDDDDHREYSKFSFASEEQVFSASPSVDCHL